jgi:hypothetical protein
MSSGGPIISNRTFINNDTANQVDHYIDEICSDPKFLCDNRNLCGTSTSIYSSIDNVNKICEDMKLANECENNFKECVVSVTNSFDESQQMITTSFVNIILPIKGAFDENSNQKFLRLPSLSGSRKPGSLDVCNVCACMNRFSTSPGSGAVVNQSSYTSPGQNTCMYTDFIEHYYYPLSIENITDKLANVPPVKIGKYTVLNANIIYAHSEEELAICSLYDLLVKNGIQENIARDFILQTLYPNNKDKTKELDLCMLTKKKSIISQIKKGFFYENITFFYVTFISFLLLLLINLLK